MSTARGLVPHSAPCAAVWSCRRPADLCERGAAEGRGAWGEAARAVLEGRFPIRSKTPSDISHRLRIYLRHCHQGFGRMPTAINQKTPNGPAKSGAWGATRRLHTPARGVVRAFSWLGSSRTGRQSDHKRRLFAGLLCVFLAGQRFQSSASSFCGPQARRLVRVHARARGGVRAGATPPPPCTARVRARASSRPLC